MSFLGIRPVYLFFKQKTKKIKFKFFLLSLTTTIFSCFSRPIFVRKKCLKFLNPIFTYLETSEGLLTITKIEDNKKLTIELGLIDWLGLLVLASDSYKEC